MGMREERNPEKLVMKLEIKKRAQESMPFQIRK